MRKNIAFIVNPVSGTSTHYNIADDIYKVLDKKQFNDINVVFTEKQGHGTILAREFVEHGFDIVVAVGGDGTVNEVATSLINTQSALGVVSTGSGNGLGRHLKIPLELKKSLELLNHAEQIKMDYGLVNGAPFFTTCGTGFDAYVSQKFAGSQRRGIAGYMEKMFKSYFNYEPEHYRMVGNDINIDGKSFLITFANANQWGFNAFIAPEASVQDGLIDISIISSAPIIAIPTLAFQLFTKNIHKDLLVNTLRTNEVTLYRDAVGPFHRDGDPYEEGKKIHIKMVPDGLNVMVRKRF